MQAEGGAVESIKFLLQNMEELEKISRNPIISELSRRALVMQMGDSLSEVIDRCFDFQSDLAGRLESTPLPPRGMSSALMPVTTYSAPPPNNGEAIRAPLNRRALPRDSS